MTGCTELPTVRYVKLWHANPYRAVIRRRISNDSAPVSHSPCTKTAAVFMVPGGDSGESGRHGGCSNPDVDFAQLLLADLSGCVRERIRCRLRLRERDDVADAVGAGHVHDQAIETKRDTAMRRRAELERVEQEAELEL